jgi:hypothetical protein
MPPAAEAVRVLATGLALNRIAFGVRFLVQPDRAGRSWIGRAARRDETQVFGRGLGARDLALGLGALLALQREDMSAQPWLAGHAVSDGTDLVATWLARDSLPSGPRFFALGMAGVSTAIALAYLAAGERTGATSPV